jgi:hypothetical protein
MFLDESGLKHLVKMVFYYYFREINVHFHMVGHTRTKAVFCVDCGKRFSSGQAGGITYHRYTVLMHLFLLKILFPPTAIFLILILLLIRFDPDSIRSARSGSEKPKCPPKEKNLKKIHV